MPPGHDPVTAHAQARVAMLLRGKWRLDALLGVGGMPAVYAAPHRNSGLGTIKILHAELSVEPEMRTRFLREGYAANTVGHPGALRVFDDDTAEATAAGSPLWGDSCYSEKCIATLPIARCGK